MCFTVLISKVLDVRGEHVQGCIVGGREGALWLPAGGIRASQGTFSSFDWLQGPHIGQNFEKHSKIFFSETVKGMRTILCIHVPDSGLYRICVFIPVG